MTERINTPSRDVLGGAKKESTRRGRNDDKGWNQSYNRNNNGKKNEKKSCRGKKQRIGSDAIFY